MKSNLSQHIKKVEIYLNNIIFSLKKRSLLHDYSKKENPEKDIFEKYSPLLANVEFGSEEYKQHLKKIKPATDHHYKTNSHHPEYFKNGINGMTLIDLCEMICDWMAAVERNKNGDINKSLEICKQKYNISDQLFSILKNTVKELKK